MERSLSQKRQIENEVVFRSANEKIQKSFKKLEKIAKEEGDQILNNDMDPKLYFYCECSDENCRERIILRITKYREIHKDRSQFIVKPGHHVASIEQIVHKKPKYTIVDKFITPPEIVTSLKQTNINNV